MEGGSEEHEGLEELAGLNSGKGMTSEEEQPQQINTNTNVTTSLVKEKDNLMPPSNVTRIMRKVLPLQAKISDDAKVTILDIISEYISFITHEASVQCHSENRKIITGEDIIWAMKKLGFNNYVGATLCSSPALQEDRWRLHQWQRPSSQAQLLECQHQRYD
ncbi:hypothetical protein J5N97_005196 [Dioscorea zingiberensis]|uniref:Transcription factor CBF/NF-Y/archaeal histone domain-containing protein n=1 Tax=Dioscorea zingiberensis TaxID=325984 RepID=A0A9D5D7L8_9LILI|nr:hypothetical protein J5N97_005196 [Dioscorea zingiberensis]